MFTFWRQHKPVAVAGGLNAGIPKQVYWSPSEMPKFELLSLLKNVKWLIKPIMGVLLVLRAKV